MDLRERRLERSCNGGGSPDPGGADLDPARNETRRFMNAGRDAVERALSGDSAAFLEASAQVGGE